MHEQLLARYDAGSATVRAMVAGLTPAELNRAIGPGTWSIRQVVIHLLDSDLIATHRIRRMVAEELPLLVSYDETVFAEKLGYEHDDITLVCDLFELNRRFTSALLRRLPASGFERVGIHTQRGRVTVGETIEIYARHVEHHLEFVKGKRTAIGKPM